MDVHEVRRAAAARVMTRERPPEHKTVSRNADGSETRVQIAGGPGEYLGPVTAGEWLDDRIVRTPPHLGPWTAVLYEIAEAAREGAAAAVAATGGARQLGDWDAWHLYCTLQAWRSAATAEAAPVMRAVTAEWRRLGLPDAEPADTPVAVRGVVNEADLSRPGLRRPAVFGRPACLDGVS